jgi:hypothetical protein
MAEKKYLCCISGIDAKSCSEANREAQEKGLNIDPIHEPEHFILIGSDFQCSLCLQQYELQAIVEKNEYSTKLNANVCNEATDTDL